jgi:hypothetical protein
MSFLNCRDRGVAWELLPHGHTIVGDSKLYGVLQKKRGSLCAIARRPAFTKHAFVALNTSLIKNVGKNQYRISTRLLSFRRSACCQVIVRAAATRNRHFGSNVRLLGQAVRSDYRQMVIRHENNLRPSRSSRGSTGHDSLRRTKKVSCATTLRDLGVLLQRALLGLPRPD